MYHATHTRSTVPHHLIELLKHNNQWLLSYYAKYTLSIGLFQKRIKAWFTIQLKSILYLAEKQPGFQ